MYDWVNIHCNILVMDEQIKCKRLCRYFFCAGDVEFFFLLLEMRDLNKLTSKLEVWRRECLILVDISMFCNRCKNILAETYLQSF